MTAVLLAHGGYDTWLSKGRLLPNTRATRNPWVLPGSCSLPAMTMPSSTKRISKTLGLQHMTQATRQRKTRSSYSKLSPPRASDATSYPLILADGLASYSREKNRGHQAGTHSAAHLPSPLQGPTHSSMPSLYCLLLSKQRLIKSQCLFVFMVPSLLNLCLDISVMSLC